MHKNLKFGLIIAVILGTLGWLAAGGINQTASYYKEIADLMGISFETVRTHVRTIYEKLHVHSRTEATLKYLGR